ncbi:MAG: LLM class F420-dependent oxidoreductase [Acidobacteria bacterium]|nr:LLM class F420-dependent oxidoreductase [Acidobacteriota bacterium]
MSAPRGYGITIPFDGVPLDAQRDWITELVDLGYTDVWSAETDGADAFTPLALTSVWAPSLRLGTAIVPVFTRGPAVIAQSAAALAEAAPGRFVLGIGTSSNVIVSRWNGIAFDEPYRRMRDTLRFLRAALSGEKVTETYDTFSIHRFRLSTVPEQAPPILVAALREGMLNLAGREGDGAIINWLSAEDVATVAPIVRAHGQDKEIVARIFVVPSADTDTVRAQGRFAIAAYLNVPVYRAFHEWLGRGPQLQGMWDAWAAGDRARALELIPDEVVDQLIVHGTPEQCRAQIQRYVDNGVTTPALAVLGLAGVDVRTAVRELAPR